MYSIWVRPFFVLHFHDLPLSPDALQSYMIASLLTSTLALPETAKHIDMPLFSFHSDKSKRSPTLNFVVSAVTARGAWVPAKAADMQMAAMTAVDLRDVGLGSAMSGVSVVSAGIVL